MMARVQVQLPRLPLSTPVETSINLTAAESASDQRSPELVLAGTVDRPAASTVQVLKGQANSSGDIFNAHESEAQKSLNFDESEDRTGKHRS